MTDKNNQIAQAMRQATSSATVGGGIHPEATKGPDGISPAARRAASNIDIQRQAWETALRGNPQLAEQLRREGNDQFRPQSAADMQRAMDAIHEGSGGKSDGRGQVYREGPATPKQRAANAVYWNNRARNHDVRGHGDADTTARRPAARENGVSAFKAADQAFRTRRDAGAKEGSSDANGVMQGGRGWANPRVQAAAQKAKGNKYNGPSE